jgi:tetratricopeptide (TPR) repeat protein
MTLRSCEQRSEADQVKRIDQMLAHYYALIGRSRNAFRMAAASLRNPETEPLDRAQAFWTSGLAMYRAGHYSWARDLYLSASAHLRLLRKDKLLSQVLVNLALVAKSQGNMPSALAHFDEAAAILPRQGYTEIWLRLLINRGVCLYKTGQIDSARSSFMEARSLVSDTNDSIHRAMIDNNLGHMFRAQGNLGVAEEYHRSALELSRHRKLPRQESLSLEFLGEVLTEQGRYEEALSALDHALAIAKNLGIRGDVVMEVLRRRGEALVRAGSVPAGMDDLRECMRLCEARGEARELALAERSYWMASVLPETEFEDKMQRAVQRIDRAGDRFEFARTICILEDRTESFVVSLVARVSGATIHYLNQMGNRAWSDRLQALLYSQQDPTHNCPSQDRRLVSDQQ